MLPTFSESTEKSLAPVVFPFVTLLSVVPEHITVSIQLTFPMLSLFLIKFISYLSQTALVSPLRAIASSDLICFSLDSCSYCEAHLMFLPSVLYMLESISDLTCKPLYRFSLFLRYAHFCKLVDLVSRSVMIISAQFRVSCYVPFF